MKTVLALLVLFLAGCANLTPEQITAYARATESVSHAVGSGYETYRRIDEPDYQPAPWQYYNP